MGMNISGSQTGPIWESNSPESVKEAKMKKKEQHNAHQKDSIRASDAQEAAKEYKASANRPDLSQYKGTGNPEDQLPPEVKEQNQFESEVEHQLFQLSQEESPEFSSQVEFAMNHPGEGDPVAQAKAQELFQKASDSVRQKTGNENFSPTLDPKAIKENDDNQSYKSFEKSLNNSNETPENKNLLRLANSNPEFAKTLSPELKQALAQMQAQTPAHLSKMTGAPDNWKGGDYPTAYKNRVSNDMNMAFQKQIMNYEKNLPPGSPKLTTKDVAQLMHMLNHPGAETEDSEKLKGLFEQLFQGAREEVGGEWNLPGDMTLSMNPEASDAMPQGAFESAFENKLAHQSPPLTEAQQTLLRQALGQNTPNLPPELKKLFEEIKGATISEIQDKYGLPKDWQPKPRDLSDPKIRAKMKEGEKMHKRTESAEDLLNGMTEHLMQKANDQPQYAPMLGSLSDYLKTISKSLTNMKENLYAVQASDSENAHQLSRMQTDLNKSHIQDQIRRAKEIADKDKKANKPPEAKPPPCFDKLIEALLAILTCGLTEIIKAAIPELFDAIMAFVKAIMTGDIAGAIQAIFKMMTAVLSTFLPDALVAIIEMVVLAVIMIVLIVLLGPIGVMAALFIFMTVFPEILTKFLVACGVDKSTAALIAMIVTLICMAIAIVVCFPMMAAASAQMAEMVTAEVMEAINIAMTIYTVVNAVIAIAQELRMAEIERLKAAMEASDTLVQAILKVLKRMLDNLLDGLTDIATFIGSINTAQSKKWTDASKVLSQLTAA